MSPSISLWLGPEANIPDYFRYFIKKIGFKIGFISDLTINNTLYAPYFKNYNKLMASLRMRVNNIIYYSLNNTELNCRFYNPHQKYDILIFHKNFSSKAHSIASRDKKHGTKIILDINVNYFDNSSKYITNQQYLQITKFISSVDFIITTTKYLKKFIVDNQFFSRVAVIPEILPEMLFKVKKTHTEDREIIRILYVGYAVKAIDLELIKDVLEKISQKYKIELILICETKPKVNINVKTKYIRFNYETLPYDMIQADLFLAPRDLEESYNLAHSFTKIGNPMAVGIPVVASPVPSYLESPALICRTANEWYENIVTLITDYRLRIKLGEEGINFCKKFYSKDIIMKKYLAIFKNLME